VSDDNGITTAIHSSHYNAKLNRCFYLVTATTISRKPAEGISTVQNLFDANENKEFGIFAGNNRDAFVICSMLGRNCNSRAEWDALVMQYMED
jgi:hypothetical protein